ncbi:response regulator [Rhizobium glycinendophyticum]|uniref:Response regulator transcription factor n=1 Tax=Rhizobium glycinendophyticum TaxID=2589807 RepID=A0A504U7V6_9HYPH|nr:response regulator transcription factor [Rhizobium glycinendophyticum]TPP11188.1 response regulator transcription factor [Rhizobium glycinendophyticum]
MAAETQSRNAISVLIVEDDAPTRQRIVSALNDSTDFEVRQAATFTEACACLAQQCPDVLLTDIQLPDGSGMDLIRRIRQTSEQTEIMVISILGDETSVISAILLGANGYILKDAFPADIADTVRDLLKGHSPISASIARFIVRRTQSQESGAPRSDLNTAKLTAREIDILWGIAKGYSYADIADHLGISRQTVPGYIKNFYRKLDVNTRGEAVYEALQQGLIRL